MANNFREKRKHFSVSLVDQCIIFRDLGSTDPPGGLKNKPLVSELINIYKYCSLQWALIKFEPNVVLKLYKNDLNYLNMFFRGDTLDHYILM